MSVNLEGFNILVLKQLPRVEDWKQIHLRQKYDNIFVMFGGRVFQQTIGIPLLESLYLYLR
jgi:hypothetical protein